MNAYLQLIRASNCGMIAIATVIGGIVSTGIRAIDISAVSAMLLVAISTFFFSAGSNTMNDYLDIDIDRMNHPERPLPAGKIDKKSASYIAAALFIAGLLPLIFIGKSWFYLAVVYAISLFLIMAYELHYKKKGITGNLIIALLTSLLFIYGGLSVSANLIFRPFIFSIAPFFATLAREITKDMEDAGGDFNRVTLPKVIGMEKAGMITTIVMYATILLGFLPLILFLFFSEYGMIFYLMFLIIGSSIFIMSIKKIYRKDYHGSQSLMKAGMSVIFIAYIAGAI